MPEPTQPVELKEEAPKPENLASELKSMANRYLVPMSEGTIKEIANGVGDVEKKVASFGDYLKETAKGLYPSLAPQLDSGISTSHLLDPYRQVAKSMLGEGFEPDFVNDPKSSAVLNGATDEKTGRPILMTLDQWKSHIMNEPGFKWGYTNQAHERMNMLLNTMHTALFGGQR
jgi:hypothetical protein